MSYAIIALELGSLAVLLVTAFLGYALGNAVAGATGGAIAAGAAVGAGADVAG